MALPQPEQPATPHAQQPAEPRWYALRVFNNRILRTKEELECSGARTYMAVKTLRETVNGRLVTRQIQLAPSLLFVRWTLDELLDYKREHFSDLMIYRRAEGGGPAPIDEREMEMFILVTSSGDGAGLEYVGERLDFKPGERVRVIEGPFKGAEGIIKRIKKDRKLLVAIQGVVVVAISHIPGQFLEKVEPART